MAMLFLPRRYRSMDASTDLIKSSRVHEYANEETLIPSKVLNTYHPKAFVSASKRNHKSIESKAKFQKGQHQKSKQFYYASRLFPESPGQEILDLRLPPILRDACTIENLTKKTLEALPTDTRRKSIGKELKKHPKTMPAENSGLLDDQFRVGNSKIHRKDKVGEAKRPKGEQMFTKQGWGHQTRGQWISKFFTSN